MVTSQSADTRGKGFKAKLRAGSYPLAMWITMPWRGILEIAGANGLDAAFIDMEHVSYGLDTVETMIMAAELSGVTPIVRAPSVNPPLVSQILDAGAHGIVFPNIDNGEMAQRAVDCMRYRPHGRRGWGGGHTRSAGWEGSTAVAALHGDVVPGRRVVHSPEFVSEANSKLATVLIIETIEGVRNVKDIVSVGGIDAVDFGWGDYSVEVGFDRARCLQAAQQVREACRAQGIGVSLSLQSKTEDRYPGCFYVVGIDSIITSIAMRQAIAAVRSVV